jgi:hypothetical protein
MMCVSSLGFNFKNTFSSWFCLVSLKAKSKSKKPTKLAVSMSLRHMGALEV